MKNERDDFAGGMYRELLRQMDQKAEQETPREKQMPLYLKENKLYPPSLDKSSPLSPPPIQHTLEQIALGSMRSDGTFAKLTELKSHARSRIDRAALDPKRKVGRLFGSQENTNSTLDVSDI